MPIPDNIKDAEFFTPPNALVELAKSIDPRITVVFYIHKTIQQSYKFDLDIFVNLQGTYWLNYTSFPYGASSFFEVVLLRFLHELGHIVCGHKGSLKIIGNQEVPIMGKSECLLHENEAWKWTLSFRHERTEIYDALLSLCKNYVSHMQYQNRDWDDDFMSQFMRIHKCYPDDDNVDPVDEETYEYFKDIGRSQLRLFHLPPGQKIHM